MEVLSGAQINYYKSILPEKEEYFITFKSSSAFTLSIEDSLKHWNGTIEYSIDKISWNEWDGSNSLSSNTENELYVRGSNNTYIIGTIYKTYKWLLNGQNISIRGNIDTLLDYQTVKAGNMPTMDGTCFAEMFSTNTSIVDISNLQMPNTELKNQCYFWMFKDCTNLVHCLKTLPANTVVSSCYNAMFKGCTSMIDCPSITATLFESSGQRASSCLRYMFQNCVNLEKLPKLYLTNWQGLSGQIVGQMFYGCSKIKLSETQTEEYQNIYKIPYEGTGSGATPIGAPYMFGNTGGTFTGTPTLNTTYYTSNELV